MSKSCTVEFAGKGIRFARSFVGHFCRELIVCIKSPAVSGVFQPWESGFSFWIGIRKDKVSKKKDFFSEEQKRMFLCYNFKEKVLETLKIACMSLSAAERPSV